MSLKNKQPLFYWDEESGIASCIITYGNKTFTGIAQCMDADRDMMSQHTGGTISLYRAEISYLCYVRDNEIKPELAALKQLYYSINKSKKFNPKSYEARMLNRQIKNKEIDLSVIKDMIDVRKKDLAAYIKAKDESYKKMRAIKKERELENTLGENE